MRARTLTLCILILFPFYLPSTISPPPPSPLFSCRKNRGAESPLPLFSGQRARERSSEEPPREQKSCDRGSSTENTEMGRGSVRFPPPFIWVLIAGHQANYRPSQYTESALRGSSFFLVIVRRVFGTIRARNAPFSLDPCVSLPSGTAPSFNRSPSLPSVREPAGCWAALRKPVTQTNGKFVPPYVR